MENKETNVVDVDFKPATEEQSINELIKNDPTLKAALDKVKADDDIIIDSVNEIVNIMKGKLNEQFTVKHALLTLAKAMNSMGGYNCSSYEEFVSEISKARDIISNSLMNAIPEDDTMNFSLRRLLFIGGTFVEYLYWREHLGDFSTQEEVEEAIAKNKQK